MGFGRTVKTHFTNAKEITTTFNSLSGSTIGLRKGTEIDLPDCLGGVGGEEYHWLVS